METWYFDTGVFVTPILKNRPPAVIEECLRWQRRAHGREIAAVTSYLTWDEVTHVAGRTAKGQPFDRAAATQAGRLLLALPGFRFVDIDEQIVLKAGSILSRRGNGPRDCLHASAALAHTGGRLLTLDSDFTGGDGLIVTRIT